jgi:hypothetical protein
MAVIQDGRGNGYQAQVSSAYRLKTDAITTSTALQGTIDEEAWNINTGVLALSNGSSSACLYFKNTSQTKDFVLPAFAVGVGDLTGTISDPVLITLVKNPTTGTIIDGTANCDMIENRNFNNDTTIAGTAYKGGQANTFTDGSDIAKFYTNQNSRLFATIDFVLPPTKSVGVTIQPNATTGGNVYVALIGYYKAAE